MQTLEQTLSCASSQKDEHELSDSPKTGRKFLSKADVKKIRDRNLRWYWGWGEVERLSGDAYQN